MSLLNQAFNSEEFRTVGHQLINLLADHLRDVANNEQVIVWSEPHDEASYWANYQLKDDNKLKLFKDIMERSIHVHHPHYIGHQVSAPAPMTALSSLLGSFLNNGSGVFEMGAAGSAIEQLVSQKMCQAVGYDHHSDGILTSGGTLANLTALLCARQSHAGRDIWTEGGGHDLAVMVSSEAHYCVDRALRIMGLGDRGIIKIPVDDQYKIRTDLLEQGYQKAIADGKKVIAVVGSAPSTSTGMYDDLVAIGDFCQSHRLWFHVDAAHGGPAIFSQKYKHLMHGSARADSIVIDGHKMMLAPSLVTFLLFKNKKDSYKTFSQKAQYLWQQNEEEEWYNLAKRTFECTKKMISIQMFSLFQMYGESIFDEFITRQYDLGRWFGQYLSGEDHYEVAVSPDSNIVCFRYLAAVKDLDAFNTKIRRQLLEDGRFYVVQTRLDKGVFIRVSIMNAFTSEDTLKNLLHEIDQIALALLNTNYA